MSSDKSPLADCELCFIDTETTGPQFGYHELIEIAAIRTSPDGLTERATWLRRIRPRHPERATEYARRLTNFDELHWRGIAESTPGLWHEFAQFAHGCVPVCHNPSFDRALITLAASGAGVSELGVDYHWIGTESLAWPVYKQARFGRLSLATLCEYLGIEPEPAVHNALDGAQACRRVYLALMARLA